MTSAAIGWLVDGRCVCTSWATACLRVLLPLAAAVAASRADAADVDTVDTNAAAAPAAAAAAAAAVASAASMASTAATGDDCVSRWRCSDSCTWMAADVMCVGSQRSGRSSGGWIGTGSAKG